MRITNNKGQPMATECASTSYSLLERVRRFEAPAWERLCALYTPIVYGWCRQAGLQDGDAADAVQDVFRSVFRGIDHFRGQPQGGSFRGWLWAITRNQTRLFFRRQANLPQAVGGTDAHHRLLAHPGGGCESESNPDATRRRIVQGALALIRGDFTATTWAAFERMALYDEPSATVAADLGLSVAAVRQAKFRVLRRLREELDGQL